MMKIIDYVVKTLIVLAALLIMGYFFPVVSWFEKPQPRKNMVFRCEMVDGKVRDYTLNLPENVTWYVGTNRGSYLYHLVLPLKTFMGRNAQ